MVVLKKILVPTDCSKNASEAAIMAVSLAEKFGSQITLLHVYENFQNFNVIPEYVQKELRERILKDTVVGSENMLHNFWNGLKLPVENVKMETQKGDPFTEIITYSNLFKFDLIVMGTHGRNGLSHMLMGSVAEKVVRHSKIPVLTMKHSKHKFKPLH